MVRILSYIFFKVFSLLYFPIHVIGLENIPRRGSFILASNHRSNLDPFILGISFGRFFSFMAKEELFEKPVLAFFMRGMWAYPIRRRAGDLSAIKETLKRLKMGSPVVMFPQGTRKSSLEDKSVEAGIGLIAVKSHVPVIPVFIEGSQKVLPPKTKKLQRHPVVIRVGRPHTFSKTSSYPQIAESILEEILQLAPQS